MRPYVLPLSAYPKLDELFTRYGLGRDGTDEGAQPSEAGIITKLAGTLRRGRSCLDPHPCGGTERRRPGVCEEDDLLVRFDEIGERVGDSVERLRQILQSAGRLALPAFLVLVVVAVPHTAARAAEYVELAILAPEDLRGTDFFGEHLALSGDQLAVASDNWNAARGAVFIFERHRQGPGSDAFQWGVLRLQR